MSISYESLPSIKWSPVSFEELLMSIQLDYLFNSDPPSSLNARFAFLGQVLTANVRCKLPRYPSNWEHISAFGFVQRRPSSYFYLFFTSKPRLRLIILVTCAQRCLTNMYVSLPLVSYKTHDNEGRREQFSFPDTHLSPLASNIPTTFVFCVLISFR